MNGMKKKLTAAFAAAAVLLSLCGCVSLLPPDRTETPAPTDVAEVTPTPTAEPTAEPTPEPTEAPEDWEKLYMTFLTENYDSLADCYPQGMVGMGFIDLDVDGSPELLLFDQGASMSMGVQFFDVADGFVTCVSASVIDVGDAFGGDHYTKTYVNANFFEDFRLVEMADGERYFFVESINGNEEFSYSEVVRFGNDGSALTLESVLYRYEEYDPDTGEVDNVRYKVSGETVGQEVFDQRFEEFFAAEDTGYNAAGVFVWHDKSYTMTYEGFTAMAKAAVAAYVPAVE